MSGAGWRGRIWGYSGAAGLIQAAALGYFLWDTSISAGWLDIMGVGSLIHAVAASAITMMGFVSRVLFSFFPLQEGVECEGNMLGDLVLFMR